jgi:hypothetical protein
MKGPAGRDDAAKERVLFLYTHNSARSQMAESLLRALAGGRYEAASAGTEATQVHPLAIRAMAEVGIDLTPNSRRPWSGSSMIDGTGSSRCATPPMRHARCFLARRRGFTGASTIRRVLLARKKRGLPCSGASARRFEKSS